MRAEKKIDHLIDWVGADRVWDFLLATCLPDDIQVSDTLREAVIDNVQTIEDESRDPDDE